MDMYDYVNLSLDIDTESDKNLVLVSVWKDSALKFNH